MHRSPPSAWSIATLLLAIALTSPPAQAQRATRLGIAGTAGIPVGLLGDSVHTGAGGLLTLVYGNNNLPLGFRFDFAQQRVRGISNASTSTTSYNITSITVNFVGTIGGPYMKPYGIAGGGWYSYRPDPAGERKNRFGLNGGLGVTYPLFGLNGFFETRYHRIYEDAYGKRYVAISTGMIL